MIDRGFVKWQPFNSLTPLKDTFEEIDKNKTKRKPVLFPEQVSLLNEQILNAYYSKDNIIIKYYENGKIMSVKSVIKKINPSSKLMELGCGKKLFFGQIIQVKSG